ncbi:MAG TPA: hypothetical protein VHW60_13995 [Caulobacteraceae bacterium]|jgi:hypothetical protein|nr:hypothetical protein [Caulobacteraceae bacterium]
MLDALAGRGRHLRTLIEEHPWGAAVGLLGLVYASFNAWRDDFATPTQQAAVRAVNFLPHLSLAWWTAIAFAISTTWLFEASFKRQRPGLHILKVRDASERWIAMFGDTSKILKAGAVIRIKNATDHRMEYCRVQLRIDGGVKPLLPSYGRFRVTGDFALVPDDVIEIVILKQELSTVARAMTIPTVPIFAPGMYFPHDHILSPGNYTVTVEVLAADSRMATRQFKLTYDGKRWFLDGLSPFNENAKPFPVQASSDVVPEEPKAAEEEQPQAFDTST